MTNPLFGFSARSLSGDTATSVIRCLLAIALVNSAESGLGAEHATESQAASEWSQWRGPNRDGVAVGFLIPEVWPDSLEKQWAIEVGDGYSSPVGVCISSAGKAMKNTSAAWNCRRVKSLGTPVTRPWAQSIPPRRLMGSAPNQHPSWLTGGSTRLELATFCLALNHRPEGCYGGRRLKVGFRNRHPPVGRRCRR